MNRKVLSSLLLLPLAIFLGEQAFGSRATDAQTETVGQTVVKAEPHSPSVLSGNEEEEKIDAIAQMIHGTPVDFEETVSSYMGILPDELQPWLDEALLGVVRQRNPLDFDEIQMFSRCASGYQYRIFISSESKVLPQGVLYASQGCSDQIIGLFSYDLDAREIKMQLPLNMGMASLAEYFDLYQIAYEEA